MKLQCSNQTVLQHFAVKFFLSFLFVRFFLGLQVTKPAAQVKSIDVKRVVAATTTMKLTHVCV